MGENKNIGCSISLPGLGTLLTVLFVALKLCHVIEWSWVWVLAPFWISAAISIPILVIAIIILIIAKNS